MASGSAAIITANGKDNSAEALNKANDKTNNRWVALGILLLDTATLKTTTILGSA